MRNAHFGYVSVDKWEDNIKTCLRQIGCEVVVCIQNGSE